LCCSCTVRSTPTGRSRKGAPASDRRQSPNKHAGRRVTASPAYNKSRPPQLLLYTRARISATRSSNRATTPYALRSSSGSDGSRGRRWLIDERHQHGSVRVPLRRRRLLFEQPHDTRSSRITPNHVPTPPFVSPIARSADRAEPERYCSNPGPSIPGLECEHFQIGGSSAPAPSEGWGEWPSIHAPPIKSYSCGVNSTRPLHPHSQRNSTGEGSPSWARSSPSARMRWLISLALF
jgi:hypothetical protein